MMIFRFLKTFVFRTLLIASPILGGLACSEKNKQIEGYVGIGNESATGGSGPTVSTPSSTLLVMAPEQNSYVFAEGTSGSIVVIFNKKIPRESTLNWQIQGGGIDFQTTLGTIPLALEDDRLTIPLTIPDDQIFEGDETFNLKLVGEGTVFLSPLVIPIKVTEVTPEPVVSFSTPIFNIDEDGGQVTIPVQLSQPSSRLINVSFLTTGSAAGSQVDYWLVPFPSITFNPGTTSTNLILNITDDGALESYENVIVTLDAVTVGKATIDNANKTVTTTIKDDDALSLFLIQGITGTSTDVIKDAYLTEGTEPTVHWTSVPLATKYTVSILNAAGNTVICPAIDILDGTITQHTFLSSACTLLNNTAYSAKVVVETSTGTFGAQNTVVYSFTIDSTSPSAFDVLGAMGTPDLTPDAFLAGSVKPTVAWVDTTGEHHYLVSIYAADGTTVVCAEKSPPANVTAYSFDDCTLTQALTYKISVKAVDTAGNTTLATNNLLPFLVTEVPGGYVIQGVTGGVSDTTKDRDMTDGLDPVIHWDITNGSDAFIVAIYSLDGMEKCKQTLAGDSFQATFTNCRLNLHEEYDVRVTARDANNIFYPAANSPYRIRNKVGLYISGSTADKSYFKGTTINSCGGTDGSLCDATNPFVISEDFFEGQIRVSNNGVIAGAAYSSAFGALSPSNGLLKIRANYLRLDTGGTISMNARGHAASSGPGEGTDGNPASGASHGGLSYALSGLAPAPAYGSAKNPYLCGSGGGNNGSFLGGAGGGVIDITVAQDLIFFNGNIQSNGGAPLVAATNAGGGSGGSIIINAFKIMGSGAAIRTDGGAGNGSGSPGSGGRVALYYQHMAHAGDVLGMNLSTVGGTQSGLRGASGTIFYKDLLDPLDPTDTAHTLGSIFTENPLHTQGVETPIDLAETFDSIYTKSNGTFIVRAGDTYTLQTNTLNYRMVVEGTLHLPLGNTHFIVGPFGMLEWRRSDAFNESGQWNELTVAYGGVITHSYNNAAATPLYWLHLTNFSNIHLLGRIDVTGRGYPKAEGPGKGTGAYGGSYGGLGANINAGTRLLTYGKSSEANLLGSGGGNASGGGFVKISNGTQLTNLEFRGLMRAAGSTGCGGGSGGSLLVEVNTISGSGGVFSVVGGDGIDCGAGGTAGASGSGGGGRIALYYDIDLFNGGLRNANLETYGGNGGVYSKDGAAGTAFLKHTGIGSLDTVGHLISNNGTRRYIQDTTTLLTSNDESLVFNSITTDSSATLHFPTSYTTFQLPTSYLNFRVVNEGEFTFPSTHLRISYGGYLEWRKLAPLEVHDLTVEAGGIITHSYNASTKTAIVSIHTTNNLNLYGTIDVSDRGYPANQGPGKPAVSTAGAGHGGAGGVGAHRATVSPGPAYGMDKVKAPDDFGSGSLNRFATIGAAGGGYIHLQVDNALYLSGSLYAIGEAGQCSITGVDCTAGGSGGSIFIEANTINGPGGNISVNGGNGGVGVSNNYNFHGGGGRIAIIYSVDNVLEGGLYNRIVAQRIQAAGGDTRDFRSGAAGSIFLKTIGASLGDVYYHNGNSSHIQNVETPVSDTLLFDKTTTLGNAYLLVPAGVVYTLPSTLVTQKLVVEGTLNYTLPYSITLKSGSVLEWRKNSLLELTNLTLESGSLLTHSYNLNTEAYKLFVKINGNLTLNGGSVVNVDDRGLQNATRPASATGAQGYGGSGPGAYGGSSFSATPYGSATHPIDLGSGGSSCAGGGLIHFEVLGTTLLNGRLTASGVYCGTSDGSGSGGSIYIDTNGLSGGTGQLFANGGSGNGNGGAGGRIGIIYDTDNYGINNLSANALGGIKSTAFDVDGGAGTIYFKHRPSGDDQLIIRNSGRSYNEKVWTQVPAGLNVKDLVVDSAAPVFVESGSTLALPTSLVNFHLIVSGTGDLSFPSGDTLTIGNQGTLELRTSKTTFFPKASSLIKNIVVLNGGTITHTSHTYALGVDSYSVFLRLNNLDLYGNINTVARGFLESQGSGKGNAAPSSGGPSGGSHGGYGHIGQSATRGTPYDSIYNPTELGSGAGPATYSSGSGGGRVRLEILNTLKLYGQVLADGGAGAGGGYAGGGSGGTINILTDTITGSGGIIQARGGNPTVGAGAGGGGRINLAYITDNYAGGISNIAFRAEGGTSGYNAGGAGTVFLNQTTSIPFIDPYPLYPADLEGRLIINNGAQPYSYGSDTYLNHNFVFNVATGNTLEINSTDTGIFIPSANTITMSSSIVNYPLRLQGTVIFPNDELTLGPKSFLNFDNNNLLTLNSLTMEPGSVITHVANSTTMTKAVRLKILGDLNMKSQSKIDVSSLGFTSGSGPGSASGSVYGGAGGSHGGLGGGPLVISSNTIIPAPGPIYPTAPANPLNPTQLGSGGGGGNHGAMGGAGGGYVNIEVGGVFTLEGAILANGTNITTANRTGIPAYFSGGGGAGGGVSIKAQTLTGLYGSIYANGGTVDTSGTCPYCGGGGGGGRIYIEYVNDSLSNFTYSVLGGSGQAQGRDGTYSTVYFGP